MGLELGGGVIGVGFTVGEVVGEDVGTPVGSGVGFTVGRAVPVGGIFEGGVIVGSGGSVGNGVS